MNNEAQSEAKLARASRVLGAKIVGALVVATLALTFASPSKALIMNFGEVEASLDTVISIGASVRLSERNTKFLPSGNGGPKDFTPLTDSGVAALVGGITGAAFIGAANQFGIILPAGHDTTAGAVGAYLAAAGAYGAALGAAAQGDPSMLGDAGLRFGLYAGTAGAAQGARARESIGIDVSHIDFTATAAESGLAVGLAYVAAFTANAATDLAATTAHFNAVNAIYTGILTTDCGMVSGVSDFARTNGSGCFRAVTEQYNYDGSINRDNGRLNFDFGDVISAPVKATPELAIGWGDWRAFVRASAFWDVVLTDPASWRRDDPSDVARPEVIRNIELLDAYVSKDGEFLGSAYTIRAGRQVINWGEATFVTGGNAVFNPISVPAIRRPGSELKEAFLPVEAIHVAYSMPGDLTLEGYYGFWDRFRLDRGGSPFASQDTVYQGSTTPSGAWIGSGLYSGFGKVNCDVYGTRLAVETGAVDGLTPGTQEYIDALNSAAVAASPFTRVMYQSMLDAANAGGRLRGSTPHAEDGDLLAQSLIDQNCDDPIHPGDDFSTFSFTAANPHASLQTAGAANNVPYDVGQVEAQRRAYGDSTGEILRLSDEEPRTEGSWGVALRWYSEALNSTEFGFYYQNYDSRIPYANFTSEGSAIGVTTVGPNASDQGRSLDNIGCGSWYYPLHVSGGVLATAAAGANASAADQLAAQRAAVAGSFAGVQGVSVEDPGMFFASDDGSDGIAEALARKIDISATGTVTIVNGEVVDARNVVGTYSEDNDNAFLSAKYTDGTNTYAPGKQVSMARAMEVVCRTALANESTSFGGVTTLDKTGEMRFGIGPRTGLRLAYPENLQVIGASFNTTLFGWGLQGELAYRPDFPLGRDSTAQTIAALVSGCFLQNYGPKGTTIHDLLGGLSTGYRQDGISCTDQYVEHIGWTNADVLNFDIGTTATFTRSSPLVRLLRADLGILLTEVAGVYAHGIDKYKVPTELYNPETGGAALASDYFPLAGQCTSGSDLPLGGIFALDPRAEGECRPTEFSMGMVLLGQLQYNNVFGTAIGLRPTMSWSYGLLGRSPSPAGTWREGVGSFSVSVSAEYLSSWSGSVAYVHYLGDELYTENLDRNFFSASLSYAF